MRDKSERGERRGVSPTCPPTALSALADHADAADANAVWPEASWNALRESGALAWAVPERYGGLALPQQELLESYERLARVCLTTCFLLTQRDAAVRRIAMSRRTHLCEELLPALARGDAFATVGIAQLTTSRQHLAPVMRAEMRDQVISLDGAMPWVSGALVADHLITGGVDASGGQVLVVLPVRTPGVRLDPPLDLMALRGSCTAMVRCEGVTIDAKWLLAGPTDRATAADGTGGLATSCLALGLAASAIDYLQEEAGSRPDLELIADRLENRRRTLWEALLKECHANGGPEAAARLRAQANACALRATQAALTAGKGSAFARPHPAQRWARQALFFLVWSCPRPAAEATLAWLVPSDACE